MKKTIGTLGIIFGAVGIITGCSSVPQHPSPENQKDAVIGRIDDLSSRPDWVRESEPFQIKDGIVTSLGSTTIPGDNRVEAAYRIAQNNAKAAIAGAIEQRLEFVFQNAEEGTSLDTTQARYIGSEASDLVSNSIRVGKVYWEKVGTTIDSGERVTRYRVFSTVSMPEEDFRHAIHAAIAKAEGKGGLSQDFAQKVDHEWDKLTGNIPQNQTTPRTPASGDTGKKEN